MPNLIHDIVKSISFTCFKLAMGPVWFRFSFVALKPNQTFIHNKTEPNCSKFVKPFKLNCLEPNRLKNRRNQTKPILTDIDHHTYYKFVWENHHKFGHHTYYKFSHHTYHKFGHHLIINLIIINQKETLHIMHIKFNKLKLGLKVKS